MDDGRWTMDDGRSTLKLSPTNPEHAPEEPTRQPASRVKNSERLALWALVALYLASAYGFALATPYGEAPDEGGHLLYIEYLVRFGKLPDISKYPYTSDSFHPPLYYLLGAAMVLATGKVSGADMRKPLAPQLLTNPHPGAGGFNVMLHPASQRWPFWPYAF